MEGSSAGGVHCCGIDVGIDDDEGAIMFKRIVVQIDNPVAKESQQFMCR